VLGGVSEHSENAPQGVPEKMFDLKPNPQVLIKVLI